MFGILYRSKTVESGLNGRHYRGAVCLTLKVLPRHAARAPFRFDPPLYRRQGYEARASRRQIRCTNRGGRNTKKTAGCLVVERTAQLPIGWPAIQGRCGISETLLVRTTRTDQSANNDAVS